ncbi:F0F1 ATP synthase subunit delta [Aquabacterium sp.]|jgi:F-type H+-transporting ATPase subunit delta|uniref:F0F1 ATP synthase subunit delta n=1 Tax=Aquabacterium sp. TaxID=1872578 RepID=UPI0025BE8393|nr:F0F1 ATP synthase subunit delta [Aquabacterium sp.]
MAELATIARPYAEALFKATPAAEQSAWVAQAEALAAVARDPQLQSLADNPKVTAEQVFDVITGAAKVSLAPALVNFLRTVLENGRLAALPTMVEQFQTLVQAGQGVSEARIYSAFPVDAAQLADIIGPLESRFGRKLEAKVELDPELIGGVRVVVGDEVLDTSIKARLERMKSVLMA